MDAASRPTGFQPVRALEACARKGINQIELARRLGIHKTTVTHWLDDTSPKPYVVARIARIAEVDFEELYILPPAERGLSYYRARAGISPVELAEQLGISDSLLRYIERGDKPRHSVDRARWAELIGLTTEEFNLAQQISDNAGKRNRAKRMAFNGVVRRHPVSA